MDVVAIDEELARAKARIAELERTAVRAAFLAEASQALSESHDYSATLPRVAHLAVPRLADWCTIAVIDDADQFRRVAVAHADPSKAELVRAYHEGFPPSQHRERKMVELLQSTRSVVDDVIDDARLSAAAQGPEHLAILRGLGVTSTLLVPVSARGATVGVLSFMLSSTARRFAPEDVATAEDLGRRIALAIDNARLLRDEKRARAHAEVSSRAKDEFLAMLSHELRNPLAPVVVALELMRDKPAGDTQRERAVIERQVAHMNRLIDDLLDVSRIVGRKLELRKEPTQLGDVVARAVELMSPIVEARRHALTLDVAEPSLRVLGDPVRLAQIFGNLIHNAAKYTEPGGKLALAARRVGREIEVIVRDDGVGMAPELVPRVFDMFVQAPRGSARTAGGLGLGLTLVRNLVELHGGTVVARSAGLGLGTEVEVRLPLFDAAAAAALARQTPRMGSLAVKRRRVLVVDDNEDAAMLLGALLSARGHEVRIAHDGPSALDLVREVAPDVAILDIGLPLMDGYELGARLRVSSPSSRLIALTGYGQPNDHAKSRDAGFSSHLVKPVDTKALLALLQE